MPTMPRRHCSGDRWGELECRLQVVSSRNLRRRGGCSMHAVPDGYVLLPDQGNVAGSVCSMRGGDVQRRAWREVSLRMPSLCTWHSVGDDRVLDGDELPAVFGGLLQHGGAGGMPRVPGRDLPQRDRWQQFGRMHSLPTRQVLERDWAGHAAILLPVRKGQVLDAPQSHVARRVRRLWRGHFRRGSWCRLPRPLPTLSRGNVVPATGVGHQFEVRAVQPWFLQPGRSGHVHGLPCRHVLECHRRHAAKCLLTMPGRDVLYWHWAGL